MGPFSKMSSLSMVICLVNANILLGVSMCSFTRDTGIVQCSLIPICLRRVISVTELWKTCFIEAKKPFLTNVRTGLRPCVESMGVWVTDLTLALPEPQLFSTNFQKTHLSRFPACYTMLKQKQLMDQSLWHFVISNKASSDRCTSE